MANDSSVRANLTVPPKPKRKRYKETPDYMGFVKRALRGMCLRLQQEDVEDLAPLLTLAAYVNQIVGEVVQSYRGRYSWAQIGKVAGITKQSAHERWGKAGEPS